MGDVLEKKVFISLDKFLKTKDISMIAEIRIVIAIEHCSDNTNKL